MRRLVIALVLALLLAGCTSGAKDDGHFASDGTGTLQCQQHQTESPGVAYTGGSKADTAAILTMFRYYLTNGSKPYCDGKPATSVDKAWAELVVTLGGDADSVKSILAGS